MPTLAKQSCYLHRLALHGRSLTVSILCTSSTMRFWTALVHRLRDVHLELLHHNFVLCPQTRANQSVQMVVDAWGSACTMLRRGLELIERLDCLPLEGRVQMNDPDVKFWIIIVDTSKALQSLPQVLSGLEPYQVTKGLSA